MISVIIPVYKVEPYLRRCVDSVRNQTHQDFEIILVDDGSPDGCPAICDEYAAMDSRIHVIHQKNGGLSAARNAGLDYVFSANQKTPDYIAFIDSDDWVHPQYLEVLYQVASTTNSDITLCNYLSVFSESDASAEFIHNYTSPRIYIGMDVSNCKPAPKVVWGRIYSSAILRDNRFGDGIRFTEDKLFNAEVICSVSQIKCAYVEVALYFYYQRNGSLMHSGNNPKHIPVIKLLLNHVGTYDDDWKNAFMLIASVKMALVCRYNSQTEKDLNTYRECSILCKSLTSSLMRQSDISMKKKLPYLLFLSIPFTYRLFRIIDDPTLLQHERTITQKRKEQS